MLTSEGRGGEGPACGSEIGVLTAAYTISIGLPRMGAFPSIEAEQEPTDFFSIEMAHFWPANLVANESLVHPKDGTIHVLTSSYQGKAYNSPNDLTLDSLGRIYFSDPRVRQQGRNATSRSRRQTGRRSLSH